MLLQIADIWSLGVTLYCLVVGRVPFHEENILALYNKIRTQPFTYPEDKVKRQVVNEVRNPKFRTLRKHIQAR